MNWPFLIRATLFGMLFFLYNVASGIVVLGAMPDTFGWLKVVASGVVAFVIGTFTFVRDPEKAWHEGPVLKTVLLALAALGLASCALFTVDRPQVVIDYGDACLTYADTKANIAVMEVKFVDLCAAGTLPPKSCDDLAKGRDRLQLADQYVRDQLKNPKQPIDWGKVNDFLQQALGIAIKLGVKGVTAGVVP